MSSVSKLNMTDTCTADQLRPHTKCKNCQEVGNPGEAHTQVAMREFDDEISDPCFAMRKIYDDVILDTRGKEAKQLHSVIG